MPTKREFLTIIRNDSLRTALTKLIDPVSVEFHESLLDLLQRLSESELEKFAERWSEVPDGMRTAFVAFVVSGDDPDGRFLAYLDESEGCQEAIDLAFRVHVENLHSLGRSVAKAEKALQGKVPSISGPVVSALSEADRAENVLELLEQKLEGMVSAENSTVFRPLIDGVQQAMTALRGTRLGLRTMAGRK